MSTSLRNNLLISFSFFLCISIDSFSFFSQLNEIKPSLLLLTLIYWNLALPEKMGIGFSIVVGLIYDILQGTLMGLYPFIFVIISYLFQRFFYQIRPMRLIQQSIIIFFLTLIVRFFLSIDFNNSETESLSLMDLNYFSLSLINALIHSIVWPVVFFGLRFYRRKWIKT